MRENVIPTNFGAKIWWENLAPIWEWGRGGTPGDHTYQHDVHVPPVGGGLSGTVMRMWKKEISL